MQIRAVLWGHPPASMRHLVHVLTRARVEVSAIAGDVASVREVLSTTAADVIVASAAAVNARAATGRTATRRIAFDLPMLLIGVPDAPASRRLLLDPTVDFVSERPTAFEVSIRIERLCMAARARLAYAERPIPVRVKAQPLRLDKRGPSLTPTEFALLSALARADGAIVSSAELAAVLREHGSRSPPGSNLLPVYISYLRRKLAVSDGRVVIRTHHGRGYSLACADDRELHAAAKQGRRTRR